MAQINTVLGTIDTSQLGFTLMHEHLAVASAGISQYFPQLFGDNLEARLVTELAAAKKSGIDTICDVTPHDLGRDPLLMKRVSQGSGVNIIACAGWYTGIPFYFQGLSPEKLADVFVREIKSGIGATGVRPGLLKAASDMGGVKVHEETILRAVARAHLATGVPIVLHSYAPGEVARCQIEILKGERINLSRVKIEHCNDTTDMNYLTWILEQGCWLGMDRYPGPPAVSPLERTFTAKKLIDAGWGHRLILSHDWTLAFIPRDEPYWQHSGLLDWQFAYLFHQRKRDEQNPYGLLYLNKVVLPIFRELGLDDKIFKRILTENPRKFFEGE